MQKKEEDDDDDVKDDGGGGALPQLTPRVVITVGPKAFYPSFDND